MNDTIDLGNGAQIKLAPYYLTAEERAMIQHRPEPESPYHGWLIGRKFQAIDDWKINGQPLMLCEHLFSSPGGVRYWFPAIPLTELCETCGEQLREAMNRFPRRSDHCDACGLDVDPSAWMQRSRYDTCDWRTTALLCDPCCGGFGLETADQEVSRGLFELESLANSGAS